MKKPSKPIDVLFCGLIRLPNMFKQSIKELAELRKKKLVKKIIFSTWDYEIDKYPGIRKFFKDNKVILIESKEPKDTGPSHMWCQMLALELGLKKTSKNAFILKSRADVHIKPEFIEKLIKEKEKLLKITSSLPGGNIFKYKVWVPWYEITKPFYMADECFLAYYNDMKKLYNYDDSYDIQYGEDHGIPHIRRFMHPFLKKYPTLADSLGQKEQSPTIKYSWLHKLREKLHLHHYKIMRNLSIYRRFRILKKELKNPKYIYALAVYYYILYSHFYIDSVSIKNPITFMEHSKPKIRFHPYNIEKNLTKKHLSFSTGNQIFNYDNELIKNTINKKLEKTKLSLKIYKALNHFLAQSSSDLQNN